MATIPSNCTAVAAQTLALTVAPLPGRFLSASGKPLYLLSNQVVALVSLRLSFLSFDLSVFSLDLSLVALCLRRQKRINFCRHRVHPSIHPCFDGLDPGVELFTTYSVHGLGIPAFVREVTDWRLIELHGFQFDTFLGLPIPSLVHHGYITSVRAIRRSLSCRNDRTLAKT